MVVSWLCAEHKLCQAMDKGELHAATGFHGAQRSFKACDVSRVDSFGMFAFPTSQTSADPFPDPPKVRPRSQESVVSEWTNPSRRSPPSLLGEERSAWVQRRGGGASRWRPADERDGRSAPSQSRAATPAPEEGGSRSVTVTDLLPPGKVDLSRCYRQPRNNRLKIAT